VLSTSRWRTSRSKGAHEGQSAPHIPARFEAYAAAVGSEPADWLSAGAVADVPRGRGATIVHFDARAPAQVERLFRETEEQLWTPFILVDDAGIDSSGKEVAEMPIEDWDDETRTNLYGPFYCSQQFIRARRAAGGRGKIINITFVHQEIPRAGAAGYDVAKDGLRNLTRMLA